MIHDAVFAPISYSKYLLRIYKNYYARYASSVLQNQFHLIVNGAMNEAIQFFYTKHTFS